MPSTVSAYLLGLLGSLLAGDAPALPDTLYFGLRSSSGEIGTQSAKGYARVPVARSSLQYVPAGENVSVPYLSLTGINGIRFPMFTGEPSPNGATQWFLTEAQTGAGNEWASGSLNPLALNGHLTQAAAAGAKSISANGYLFGLPGPAENLNLYDILVFGSACTGNMETGTALAIGKPAPDGTALVTLSAPLQFGHAAGETFTRDSATRYYALGFVEPLTASITLGGGTEADAFALPPSAYLSSFDVPGANDPLNRLLVGMLNGTTELPPAQWYLGLTRYEPDYGLGGEVFYMSQEFTGNAPQATGYERQPVTLTARGGGEIDISTATWNFTSDFASATSFTANNAANMWFLTDAPLDTSQPDAPATHPQAGIIYAVGSLLVPLQSELVAGAPGSGLTLPAEDITELGVDDKLLVGSPCLGLAVAVSTPTPPVLPSTASPGFYQLGPAVIGLTEDPAAFAPGQAVTRIQSLRVYQSGSSETVNAKLLLKAG